MPRRHYVRTECTEEPGRFSREKLPIPREIRYVRLGLLFLPRALLDPVARLRCAPRERGGGGGGGVRPSTPAVGRQDRRGFSVSRGRPAVCRRWNTGT